MMISAWHLIWIVPLTGGVSMFVLALFMGRSILDLEKELKWRRKRDNAYAPCYDDDREECGLLSED